MQAIPPIFTDSEMLFCSVPVPPINAHKGAAFDFTPQQIANYGQSQTHPSIFYFPDGWNGHKYWLATTPYPHAYGVFENPCIYYGDETNGRPPRVFTPISGTASGQYTIINNPVVKILSNQATNSDPDLWYDSSTGKLWLISRDNGDASAMFGFSLWAQDSLTGQAWKPRGTEPLWRCSTGPLEGKPEFLSPAILKIGTKIRIYNLSGTAGVAPLDYVKNTGINWGLYIMEGTTLENGGDFVFTRKAAILGKRGIEPWHMDMFVDSRTGYIYMICSAANRLTGGTDVYLAESKNGFDFVLFAKPLLATYSHYRPTATLRESDNMLIVYFSVLNAPITAARYPNGASDVPVDGRAIGLSYKKFDDVLSELRNDKVYGYV